MLKFSTVSLILVGASLLPALPARAEEVTPPAAVTPVAPTQVKATAEVTPPVIPPQQQGGPAAARHGGDDDAWHGRVVELQMDQGRKADGECTIGCSITLRFEPGQLRRLLMRAERSGKRYGLFLDGHFMKGLVPLIAVGEPDTLRFTLERNEDNKMEWIRVLGGSWHNGRTVPVTVGLEDGTEWALSTYSVHLVLLRSWKAIPLSLGMVAFLLIMLRLTQRTSLLRDWGRPRTDGRLSCYSLGRMQMAFWFVNIVFAFLLIWAVTGVAGTVSTSVMTLMGIGFGTALGAAVIDDSKASTPSVPGGPPSPADLQALRQKMQEERTLLLTQIRRGTESTPPAPDLADKKKALYDLEQQMIVLDDRLTPASEGLVPDLLMDAGGYSLHRLQMVIWTLVLFFLFWGSVLYSLMMPEFDGTVLAVMGISSGTYLGFKLPEKKS